MSHISLRHVYKSYLKQKMVIKDLSLEIFDDEFLVFVGPSGCGKTTTLRMIAGLEEITKGDLLINHIKQNDKDPSSRLLNFVFQNYALLPSLTVFENIEFGLLNLKLSKLEKHLMIETIAKKLNLMDKLGSYPHQLSGGQRQRVALARALVDNQKLILFDEPLSNLDAVLRSAMRRELTKFKNEFGVTAIYVTHDQIEAMGLSSRIVLMIDGEIIQTGTPYQMFNDPNHLDVATFIGSPETNVIKGIIEHQTFTHHGKAINLNSELQDLIKNHDREEVYLAIRPQDIKVYQSPKPGLLKGNVIVVEQFGSNQLLHIEIEGIEILVVVDNDRVYQGSIYLDFQGQAYLFDEKKYRMRKSLNKEIILNIKTIDETKLSVLRELTNYGYQLYTQNDLQFPIDLQVKEVNSVILGQRNVYLLNEQDGLFILSSLDQTKEFTLLKDILIELSFIKKKEI